jgi:hypothetical protein
MGMVPIVAAVEMGQGEPQKRIETPEDLTEAIDRGFINWLGGAGKASYVAQWPVPMSQRYKAVGAKIAITGYNGSDIVALRFGGDGK